QRPAQAPGRSHAAARGEGGCRDRAARSQAARRHAVAHPGPDRAPGTRSCFAAGGAGDAGNRPRVSLWRSIRRVAGGSRRGTRQGGDVLSGVGLQVPEPSIAPGALEICGVTLAADLSGALFWEEQSLLVVSDLHLEKGSSFAARGVLLPPYDTVATLGRLSAVIARHDPRVVIALGDSFLNRESHGRLSHIDRDGLGALQARR